MEEAEKHILIAAPTGGGKSYLLGSLIERIYGEKKPLLILDTKTRNHIGLVQLHNMKLLRIKPGCAYDWDKALSTPYILSIPHPSTRTKELIQQYNGLLEAAYDTKKPRTIVVEEAHLYNPSPQHPNEHLEIISREGRGYGMNLVQVTQRIQDYPKLLWSQCRATYVMKFMIPQDIKYLSSMIPEFPQLNQQLNLHDVLRYDHVDNSYQIIKAADVKRITPHLG